MKEVAGILSFIAIILAAMGFMLFMGWVAGSHQEIVNINSDLIKRGLKQYNQQTGKLEWTEKGGGNDN